MSDGLPPGLTLDGATPVPGGPQPGAPSAPAAAGEPIKMELGGYVAPGIVPDGLTVDETTGEQYVPQFYGSTVAPKEGSYATDDETFWKNSSVGRIMSAFGAGVKTGFGEDVIGFTPETRKAWQDAGVFGDPEARNDVFGVFKAFNEALIKPAAAGLDALARGFKGVNYGIGFAAGQTATEFGSSEGASLTRDMIVAGDTVGLLAGAFPIGIKPRPVKKGAAPIEDTLRAEVPEPANPYASGDVGPILTRDPQGRVVQEFDTMEVGAHGQDIGPRTVLAEKNQGAATDFAGGINLDRISTTEDVKALMRDTAGREDYAPQGMGPVTYAEMTDLAAANGMTIDQYMSLGPDAPLTSVERLRVRSLLVQTWEDTWAKVQNARRTGDDQAKIDAALAIERAKVVQEYAEGVKAEAGRTLSAYNILMAGEEKAKALSDIMNALGGKATIDQLVEKIGLLETPQEIANFVRQARKPPTFGQKVIEGWRMFLVSGWETHAGNITSNTVFSAASVPERAVGAAIGRVRTALGIGAPDRVALREADAMLRGYIEGSKDGIIGSYEALKTGKSREARAMPPEQVQGGAIGGTTGEIIRLPGRFLMAEDEFFRAWAYHQELRAQVEMTIDQAGKSPFGAEAATMRQALMADPTPEIVEAAKKFADYQTFQKKLGRLGSTLQSWLHEHPEYGWVAPFIRTPTNIGKAFAERSPIGLLSRRIRSELKGEMGGRAQDMAIARMAMGTAVSVTVMKYAMEGQITGSGPQDPRTRAGWLMEGNRPYSFRGGEHMYSYRRWSEPFGSVMGLAADLAEAAPYMQQGDYDKVASLMVLSVAQNMMNMSAMRGPSDLVKVMGDWTRYGDRFVQGLAASTVPGFVSQIMRANDPYIREARTIIDAVKVRALGQYSGAFPRRDVFGAPLEKDDQIGPFKMAEMSKDPVIKELNALGMFPGRLTRKISGVELTDAQYDRYSEVTGRLLRQVLNGAVNQPGWGNMPEGMRRKTIEGLTNRARASGRNLFLMENPDLLAATVQGKLDRAQGVKVKK